MNDFGGIKTQIPGILLAEDMLIRADIITSGNAIRYQIRGQVLLENGRQVEFTQEIISGAPYTTGVFFFGLPRGILLNAAVVNPSSGEARGQTYIQLSLQRNQDTTERPFRILGNGYTTSRGAISWPPGTFESQGTGRGHFIGAALSDPAVGASLEVSTQGNTRWRLHAVSFTLSTDGNAGARIPHLEVFDIGQGWKGKWSINDNIDNNEVWKFTFSATGVWDEATSASTDSTMIPIPNDMWFDNNPDLFLTINGIKAGDQITDANWTREELVVF